MIGQQHQCGVEGSHPGGGGVAPCPRWSIARVRNRSPRACAIGAYAWPQKPVAWEISNGGPEADAGSSWTATDTPSVDSTLRSGSRPLNAPPAGGVRASRE